MIAPCAAQNRAAAGEECDQSTCPEVIWSREGHTESENPTGKDQEPSRSVDLEGPQTSNIDRVAGGAKG